MKSLFNNIRKCLRKVKFGMNRKGNSAVLLSHDCLDDPYFPSADEIDLYERIIWPSFQSLPEIYQKVLILSWEGNSVSEIIRIPELGQRYGLKKKSLSTRKLITSFRLHKDYGLLFQYTWQNPHKPK